jgi:hypothetical protein
VAVPSGATTLAFWVSSPPPKTHTPAFTASWTTAREDLATAGHVLVGNMVHRVGIERDQYRVIP